MSVCDAQAVGPLGNHHQREELMELTTCNLLQAAVKERVKSIAIPPISTGIFGYEPQAACDVIITTLLSEMDSLSRSGNLTVRHVYLCSPDDKAELMLAKLELLCQGNGDARASPPSGTVLPSSDPPIPTTTYQWQYRKEDSGARRLLGEVGELESVGTADWISYDSDQNHLIEGHYRRWRDGLGPDSAALEIAGDRQQVRNSFRYSIHFQSDDDLQSPHYQQNQQVGSKRRLRRIEVPVTPSATTSSSLLAADTDPQLPLSVSIREVSETATPNVCLVVGPSDMVTAATAAISAELDSLFKSSTIDLKPFHPDLQLVGMIRELITKKLRSMPTTEYLFDEDSLRVDEVAMSISFRYISKVEYWRDTLMVSVDQLAKKYHHQPPWTDALSDQSSAECIEAARSDLNTSSTFKSATACGNCVP